MKKIKGQISYSNFGKFVRVPFICGDICDDIEITIPDEYDLYETYDGEYMITINGITLPLNTVLKLRQKDNQILLIIPHYVPEDADSEEAVAKYWANKGSFKALDYEII